MTFLTAKQKRNLKSLAHHLNPVVYIGKNGITDPVIAAVEQALGDHELIKIKFIDFKDEKRECIEEILSRTGAEFITLIGNITVLYRENPDPEKRRVRSMP